MFEGFARVASKSGSIGIGDFVDAGANAKNITLSYGMKRSPYTYEDSDAWSVWPRGNLVGNSYVFSSYGRKLSGQASYK